MTSYGIWTTAGLNLAAASGVIANAKYVGISTGCGTLSVGLSISVTYSSLSLTNPLPANLSSGQVLILTDGTNSQLVTCSGTQTAGVNVLNVVSFLATANYAASTTAIAPQPLAGDVTLYNEVLRVAVLAAGAGASAGESLISGYADGTQATGVYCMAGYFGGSSAGPGINTGTLMIEDAGAEVYWRHTLNTDTNMYQADATI